MAETGNVAEYTVSEISMALRRTVEDAYGYVRVRGEVSGFRGQHASGHCYFALKDEKARLEAVVWRSAFARLGFKPEEGLDVIATGRLTTYPGSSKYQIVIETLEPAGIGALMALLEERRKKLAAEGLFDEARKKPLPYLPRVIGVVTSPTGAVIRDILHRLTDRFPVEVLVWPVRVQGETAAAEVAAAVQGFNALSADGAIRRPDLLIVARGGGSLEDLWSFNEEIVVRAAAASAIPLISAVGHETDWTLIDHVADRRAPTPTGAAEIAVPVRSELLAAVESFSRRHAGAMTRQLERARRALQAAARALPGVANLFGIPRRRLDDLAGRLGGALQGGTHSRRTAYERAAGRLSLRALGQLLRHDHERLAACSDRVRQMVDRFNERRRAQLAAASGRLSARSLLRFIGQGRERLGIAETRTRAAVDRTLERDRSRTEAVWKLVDAFSYRGVLERGFALVTGEGEVPIRSAASVATGTALRIEFHDGRINAVAGGKAGRRRRSGAPPSEDQGDLF